jgi:hypothetical protein
MNCCASVEAPFGFTVLLHTGLTVTVECQTRESLLPSYLSSSRCCSISSFDFCLGVLHVQPRRLDYVLIST